MNLHSKKSIPRAGSPEGTAIWSIGLLAIISDAWKAITIRKRIWDGNTGEEIPIYSVCVRIIGPFGILTHGVIEYGNLSWKIGRIAWLNPRAYSAYLQCLPPSVVRQIVEKILLWPLSRNSDPCQLEVGQPERGYESPQVGLPHSDVNETEDERKNRLSAPRIADAKSRLCPDK